MAYLLSNNCIKNYTNVTTTVKITIGAWVVYFFCNTMYGLFSFTFTHTSTKNILNIHTVFSYDSTTY